MQKYDPKRQLIEELTIQESTVSEFFHYLILFKERLEFFDLENLSEEVNSYLGNIVEARNIAKKSYKDLQTKITNDGNAILAEMEHKALQKQIIKSMENITEETKYLRLPKDLDEDTKKDENDFRTKIVKKLSGISDKFFNNDLGQGGEPMLV